jgi:hypothetical protein
MPANVGQPATKHSVVTALLPILVVVLSAFLVTGLAMPVLPLHIHEDLGLGAFVVGLVAGAQFAAALLTRFLDLALGLANPALGLVAAGAGVRTVFIASALVVLSAAAVAVRLLRTPLKEVV